MDEDSIVHHSKVNLINILEKYIFVEEPLEMDASQLASLTLLDTSYDQLSKE